MSNIDIFLRLPDVADLGRHQLQDYCNQWLKRPISREFGILHLIVGSDLMLTVNLDLRAVEIVDNRIFIPICELLDYVIDQHFEDPKKRRELHAEAYDIRKRWGEVGYQYEAMGGRVGNLWLKCKNPSCDVSMETFEQAIEGQVIHCPRCQVTCPVCGHTDWYDGSDLHLILVPIIAKNQKPPRPGDTSIS
jgi:hypothetical protein